MPDDGVDGIRAAVGDFDSLDVVFEQAQSLGRKRRPALLGDDRPGMPRGVISTQRSDTVVRGRLGEWISLGGINTTGNSRRGGLGHSQATQESVVQQIEVMVECLDCAGDAERHRQLQPPLQGSE